MTPELAQQLKTIAYQLIAVATGEVPAELPLDHPPGTIKVLPTGVLGQGKARYYPPALASVPPSGVPELFWAYCLRMSEVKAPDGQPYLPAIYRQQIGQWFLGGGPPPAMMGLYPLHLDMWLHPEDYMSAEEIEAKKLSDSQWAEQYRAKYGV